MATLLNIDDPLYHFEHLMQHRQYFAVMPQLYNYGALPYLIDPLFMTDVVAGPWHLVHQQMHDDFNGVLPSYYQYNPATDINIQFDILQSGILGEENRTWWAFTNHLEHTIANDAILPLPSSPPLPAWTAEHPVLYPFG